MHKTTLSIATALLLLSAAPVMAASDPFEVKNVVVDVTAKDAVSARKEALATAQTKAFQQLVKKLRPNAAPADIKVPDDVTLGRAVKDFEIASEHVASNRYRGNFIFRFDESIISSYLPADSSAPSDATEDKPAIAGDVIDPAAKAYNEASAQAPTPNPMDEAYSPTKAAQQGTPPVPTTQTSGYVGNNMPNPDGAYNPSMNKPVTIMAYFKTLPELNSIKNRLSRSGAVSDVMVYSLSYGQAELRGSVVGSMNMLQLELGREGYSLQSDGNNRYQLRRG